MTAHRCRWSRRLSVAMLAVPLLASGPCVQIAQNAVIRGFFNVTNELLIDRAEACLTATEQGDSGTCGPVGQPSAGPDSASR